MKKVIIVAPYFPPSNLTGGHRSRYFAMHLRKFGWDPIVLTVEPEFYEEPLDPELQAIMPNSFEVIRTKAFSTKPLRIIGDLGIRSFWQHFRKIVELNRHEKIDLVYIPLPPFYSGLLGPLIKKFLGLPYAIDYIDPWVHEWPEAKQFLSKHWFAYYLNIICEPIALKQVSLITGIAPNYYQGVIDRYDWIDESICTAMGYGAEASEYEYLQTKQRPTYLFSANDGNLHFVYAGAMLPKGYDTLDALLQALCNLKVSHPVLARRLRFHFVGTGSSPSDPSSQMVKPWVEKYELQDTVIEHPARIPYLDVLNHLKSAHAAFIVGSSELHYSPSKIFQSVLSKRPVLLLIHEASTAVKILKDANAGVIVSFSDENPVKTKVSEIERAILNIAESDFRPEQIDWQKFYEYSAEAMTGKLAEAFNRGIK